MIGSDGKVIGGNGPPGLGVQLDRRHRRLTATEVIEWSRVKRRTRRRRSRSTSAPRTRRATTSAKASRWSRRASPRRSSVSWSGWWSSASGGGLNGAILTLSTPGSGPAPVLRRRRTTTRRSVGERRGRRVPGPSSATRPRRCCRRASRPHRRRVRRARTRRACEEIMGFLQTFLLVFAGVVAGRRRLHDHQHLLDPGRPAQPGAGTAASPRAPRAPDDPVGDAGGVRGGGHRLDARARRRLSARWRSGGGVRPARAGPEPVRRSSSSGRRSCGRTSWAWASRWWRPSCPLAARPGSRRCRPCGTTSRCPSPPCGAGWSWAGCSACRRRRLVAGFAGDGNTGLG